MAPESRDAADRPVRWRRWAILGALGPLAFLVQVLCATDPAWTERVYSQGVYPWIAVGLTAAFGWAPVSVAETALAAALLLTVLRCARGVRAWRAGERRIGNLCGHASAQVIGIGGVLFGVFWLSWGLNHSRMPFAAHVGLTVRAVEPARLAHVVDVLGRRAAERRPADPTAAEDWRGAVADAYDSAGITWPVLAGPRPALRTPWISRLMTLASITGIYSPFTGEPHVDGELPGILLPFVACHEVAHLRGFAREDEANFIAWWVGARAADPAVAYSCELEAWSIALAQLRRVDRRVADDLELRAPESIRRDAAAIRDFWLGQPKLLHETLTRIVDMTNDAYLKSAGHADGVRSYGRMVDLLIAALDA